jgi:hypothetical protein
MGLGGARDAPHALVGVDVRVDIGAAASSTAATRGCHGHYVAISITYVFEVLFRLARQINTTSVVFIALFVEGEFCTHHSTHHLELD